MSGDDSDDDATSASATKKVGNFSEEDDDIFASHEGSCTESNTHGELEGDDAGGEEGGDGKQKDKHSENNDFEPHNAELSAKKRKRLMPCDSDSE